MKIAPIMKGDLYCIYCVNNVIVDGRYQTPLGNPVCKKHFNKKFLKIEVTRTIVGSD